jgi:hypothetical protein
MKTWLKIVLMLVLLAVLAVVCVLVVPEQLGLRGLSK